MTTPLPDVEVAGLQIPADLAAQIIDAFRTLYPTLTEGKDDDGAVRTVLIWFIQSSLEQNAARKANTALDATIDQLRAGAAVRAEQLRGQIQAAAARIKEKTVVEE